MSRSSAYANANIALIKYWGKSCTKLNIPAMPSLSMTLNHLGTMVTIESIDGKKHLSLIKGELASEQELTRLSSYLELIRQFFPYHGYLCVKSESNIPLSAGLASSAAFFAALAKAIDAHFLLGLDDMGLSVLARMGSASAARSIFGGFSGLHGESKKNHEGSHAVSLTSKLDVAMVIAIVDSSRKPVSSREAMNMTKATSPFYNAFVEGQPDEFERAKVALLNGDFSSLGRIMEASTLKMFATMWTSTPAINYWQPKSLSLIDLVYQIRKDLGDIAFFTMDAGPNVKILCPIEHLPLISDMIASSNLCIDIKSSKPGEGAKLLDEHLS